MPRRKKNKKSTIMTIQHLIDRDLIQDKRILVRVDFNVPFDKKTNDISNDQRIKASIPTILKLLEHKPKSIVLMSHLGRPLSNDFSLTLEPIAKRLSKLLDKEVVFLKKCWTRTYRKLIKPNPGTIFLLENLRFNFAETGEMKDSLGVTWKTTDQGQQNFQDILNMFGDVYINDAFGCAHRAHSSIIGLNHEYRAAGLLMEKELEYFDKIIKNPKRPLVCIIGGAKVSDKIKLIYNLIDIADEIIIGGGMAYTFKKVLHDVEIGNSLFDIPGSELVRDIVNKAEHKDVNIYFPIDHVAADSFSEKAKKRTVGDRKGIPTEWMGLDIGPRSIKKFQERIRNANTVVWNGPMGVFEFDRFSNGTRKIMDAVVEMTEKGGISVVGGGDTATCCKKFGTEHKISHVSTGGGASLELLEGSVLPGVKHLSRV